MRLRHLAKTSVLPAAHALGLVRLAGAATGGPRRVALNWHNVRAEAFARHAAWLAEHADVVPLDEFVASRGAPARRLTVTLTFDDGYATFASEIAPILASRRMPAAWFVATSLVGGEATFWFDRVQAAVVASRSDRLEFQGRTWPLAAWNRAYVAIEAKQVIKRAGPERRDALVTELMRAAGDPPQSAVEACRIATREALGRIDPALVTIGSHSRTHPQLSQTDDAALGAELRGSKDDLEAWLGRPVRHFAYPSGDHDARVIEAVRRAGYETAWTTEPRAAAASDDPLRMPRVAVDDAASVAVLVAKCSLARAAR
jgi:peptidoglycan/xylan/chitin deacetylase (PgdA/CDA1 family)